MKRIFILSFICIFYCFNATAQMVPAYDMYMKQKEEQAREDNNIYYDQRGNYYREIGNSYYGNDGSVYSKNGNTISGSDGGLFETSGDSIYENGQEKCRRRGFYLECD